MLKTLPKALFIIVFLGLLGLYFTARDRNPYAEVEWLEDWPGAGDRYRTFTPVLKVNNKIAVGPTVGADYAVLFFEDVDKDGIKEAVIESDGSFTLEEFHPERHTLKYQPDSVGRSKFMLVKSEDL